MRVSRPFLVGRLGGEKLGALSLALSARGERGQSTVEWVGTLGVVALLMVGMVAVGVRVPGVSLARVLGSKLLCAASLADGCGDEPVLIAAYGSEMGEMVREYMPMLAFEEGSRAVPVDFRRCRKTSCGDASQDGLVHRTDAGLPVTAFVHVIDCREDEAEQVGSGGCRLLGVAGGQSLPAVLDLLRRLRHAPRHPDRRREGLPPRRLGGGADPGSARWERRRAGVFA